MIIREMLLSKKVEIGEIDMLEEKYLTQPMKKVAIYARVSTIEQAEEGYSIDEQVRILRQYCIKNNYEVYNEYNDRGISGKSIKARHALQDMLKDAKEKKFDIVLVWKTNRLARNILDLLKMIDMLEKHNIAFRSYSETIETETPSGKLQLHMMAAIAEFERGTISQNVKMGMIARARDGKWNGGKVLGYDVVGEVEEGKKRKNSRLVINEDEAKTVRRIFQLYTEGNGYKAIANKINKEGYRSKKNNLFAVTTIKEIITNPVYIGKIRYNYRRDWNEKRRRNINPNPIIEDGEHEAIIGMDVWEKAQTIFKSRSNRPSRVHDGEFLLTGIMKCPVCGSGMVIGRTTNTLKNGSKKVIEYYVCGAWKNKGVAACRSNSVRAREADQYVLDKINNLARSDRLVKDIVNKINKENKGKAVPLQQEHDKLKKAITAIDVRKNKVMGLYEEGIISKEDLSERLAKLNEERGQLEDRMNPIRNILNEDSMQEVSVELVKETMKNFNEVILKASSREQRKQLIHLLISEITVGEDRKIGTMKIKLNEEVIKYLNITTGKELSSDGSFSVIYMKV